MLVPFLERQSFPIRGNNDGNDNFILLLRFEGGVGGWAFQGFGIKSGDTSALRPYSGFRVPGFRNKYLGRASLWLRI